MTFWDFYAWGVLFTFVALMYFVYPRVVSSRTQSETERQIAEFEQKNDAFLQKVEEKLGIDPGEEWREMHALRRRRFLVWYFKITTSLAVFIVSLAWPILPAHTPPKA